MLLNSMLLFVVGAAAHSGWTVPKGQPDGIYSVTVDAAGISTHEFVKDLDKTLVARTLGNSAKFNAKRDNTGSNNIGCCGYALDPRDTDWVYNNICDQCGNGAYVNAGRDFYGISNNVVGYYCNYLSTTNQCFASEVADALRNRVTSQCGSYNAGYDYVPDRMDQYGYEARDAAFCAGRGIGG